MKNPKWVLATIVFSQFCGTSLWFAGNAVMGDLVNVFGLEVTSLVHLISSVQLGFISGTLIFALLTIADRFQPSKVFFFSASIAALFNLGIIYDGNTTFSLLFFRFSTGFFLAGIYPVGMKIASDYFKEGLGKSLGFLVGALVLGTAFPHLLRGLSSELPWKLVLVVTSSLAIFGGLLMLVFVPKGPYRKQSQSIDLSVIFTLFRNRPFRAAAFGYFGHMWELYAFWSFVPVMLMIFFNKEGHIVFGISELTFVIIGVGGLSCIGGGFISQKLGVKRTAILALTLSGFCCFVSPILFYANTPLVFIGFLVFWGMVVIADSPLLSTLVAQNAPPESKGTALTIVNSIGFAITIVSIQLLSILLSNGFDERYVFIVLAIGPIFGLISLLRRQSL